MREIYFSVDIEADGPYPGDYSMSSLGAVACAVRDTQTGIQNMDVDNPMFWFYTALKPISDKFDPETAAIAGFDRNYLIESGDDPTEAMTAFNTYVTDISNRSNAKPVFVAWPAPYDWFWTYYYLMRFAGESAFGFSGAVNMKDVYAVKAKIPFKKVGKRDAYKKLGVSARPHTHNALDDAREQGELWQSILGL